MFWYRHTFRAIHELLRGWIDTRTHTTYTHDTRTHTHTRHTTHTHTWMYSLGDSSKCFSKWWKACCCTNAIRIFWCRQTVPLPGLASPQNILISVDLPAPFGPITATREFRDACVTPHIYQSSTMYTLDLYVFVTWLIYVHHSHKLHIYVAILVYVDVSVYTWHVTHPRVYNSHKSSMYVVYTETYISRNISHKLHIYVAILVYVDISV